MSRNRFNQTLLLQEKYFGAKSGVPVQTTRNAAKQNILPREKGGRPPSRKPPNRNEQAIGKADEAQRQK
jgi:hypothetical protein